MLSLFPRDGLDEIWDLVDLSYLSTIPAFLEDAKSQEEGNLKAKY